MPEDYADKQMKPASNEEIKDASNKVKALESLRKLTEQVKMQSQRDIAMALPYKSLKKSAEKYIGGSSNGLRCVQDPDEQYSDLQLLLKNRYSIQTIRAPFDSMSAAIQDGSTWSLMNLDKMQALINESFRYLSLFKRYDALSELSNGTLFFDDDGFHIEEHVFQTLEEVDKALKHKAFL